MNSIHVMANQGARFINLADKKIRKFPMDLIASNGKAQWKAINLEGNSIEVLPGDIRALQNLVELNLEGNNLDYLPEEFGLLSSLKFIDLDQNPKIQKNDPEVGEAYRRATRVNKRDSIITLENGKTYKIKYCQDGRDASGVKQVLLNRYNARNQNRFPETGEFGEMDFNPAESLAGTRDISAAGAPVARKPFKLYGEDWGNGTRDQMRDKRKCQAPPGNRVSHQENYKVGMAGEIDNIRPKQKQFTEQRRAQFNVLNPEGVPLGPQRGGKRVGITNKQPENNVVGKEWGAELGQQRNLVRVNRDPRESNLVNGQPQGEDNQARRKLRPAGVGVARNQNYNINDGWANANPGHPNEVRGKNVKIPDRERQDAINFAEGPYDGDSRIRQKKDIQTRPPDQFVLAPNISEADMYQKRKRAAANRMTKTTAHQDVHVHGETNRVAYVVRNPGMDVAPYNPADDERPQDYSTIDPAPTVNQLSSIPSNGLALQGLLANLQASIRSNNKSHQLMLWKTLVELRKIIAAKDERGREIKNNTVCIKIFNSLAQIITSSPSEENVVNGLNAVEELFGLLALSPKATAAAAPRVLTCVVRRAVYGNTLIQEAARVALATICKITQFDSLIMELDNMIGQSLSSQADYAKPAREAGWCCYGIREKLIVIDPQFLVQDINPRYQKITQIVLRLLSYEGNEQSALQDLAWDTFVTLGRQCALAGGGPELLDYVADVTRGTKLAQVAQQLSNECSQ